jgi:hypothetical protein
MSYDPMKAVRADDPVTSVEAAEKADKFAETHYALIVDALRAHGEKTAKELEPLTGLTNVEICRRLPEIRGERVDLVFDANGDVIRRGGSRVWKAL